MRRRLLTILLLLLSTMLAALVVPLARSLAGAQQQQMFDDRLADATRFASHFQQAKSDVDLQDIGEELVRYQKVYQIAVGVVDRQGSLALTSGGAVPLGDPGIRRASAAAFDGHQSSDPPVIWPWQDDPLVVAVPVLRGDDVVAVVVTVSPTEALHDAIQRNWLNVEAAALAALLVFGLLASRLAGWVLRPVDELDAAAHGIRTGALATRVGIGTGPVELRRLARSFNDMAIEVESSMERQRAFVADASHQLRGPLAALLLRIENLGDALGPDQRCDYAYVQDEAVRLAGILDGLLALAIADHTSSKPTQVDITELLAGRCAVWAAVAAARDIEITLSGVRDGGLRMFLNADPLLLGSVFDVLLDNAVKFGPAGGRVTVSTSSRGRTTSVEVGDTGDGVPAREMPRLGDRFWRSPRHQNVNGSGVGLAVARSLLGLVGGELSFTSAVPHGLVATVTLPWPAEAADTRAGGEAGHDHTDASAQRTPTPAGSSPV